MTKTASRPTLYHGAFVHSVSLSELEHVLEGLIYVESGVIVWVERDVPSSRVQEVAAKHGILLGDAHVEVIELGNDFLVPGLVDTHTHAPQYPNLGLGQSYQLLDWLKHLTFPTEAKFADDAFAQEVYTEVVKRNLAVGTTTCSYYGSLHEGSTRILADIAHSWGQRALVGKCNMNRNCPDNYREPSAAASIDATRSLIDYIRSLPVDPAFPDDPLINPVITPRFAISCTDELLDGLGELAAKDPGLAIQTHISENLKEIEETLSLFPKCKTYTDVYDKCGLLRDTTILAHCVWMSDEEIKLIKAREAGISHCPTSNMNLMSGGARIGALLDAGVKVGLGSDCSGGFALGVLGQLRNASMLSKMIALKTDVQPSPSAQYTDKPLPIPALFYMATLGGASLCNAEDKIGNFQAGKQFDALRIRPGSSTNFFHLGGNTAQTQQDLERVFEQWLFVSDDRDVRDVWVRGRRVAGSADRS